ncbi:hypothetical protein V501_06115 [Pseudogymnoascus sp. VKM F-4519 (FW-2642)]|nr:hypothetical protein V501_06115 [Pseudogymnoascus sp. VKM F-4519 (FW-2642)]
MASTLAKFLTPILGPRRRRKIAIIGLYDAGVIDLLKRLCGTYDLVLKEDEDGRLWPRVHAGTKSSLKCDFDFVAVEVGGGGAPAADHLWTAAQFREADGFIWVVNSADTCVLVEARVEMEKARKGRSLRGGLVQPGVSPKAPWLVLVDFKQDPLSMAEATRQAELVTVDAGDDLDWTVHAVSITTAEGLREAMGWLYQKVK